MLKTIRYFLIISTAIILLFVIFKRSDMHSVSGMHGVTEENIDKLIRKEVPIGSTKDQIYTFLESNKIESSAYNAGPDPFAGLPDDERLWKQYVVAWIPENPNPELSNYDIYIYFYFDENYILTDYKLQRLAIVP